jgi:hypothetical protein
MIDGRTLKGEGDIGFAVFGLTLVHTASAILCSEECGTWMVSDSGDRSRTIQGDTKEDELP